MAKRPAVMTVEGSSDLILKLPHRDEYKPMTLAETFLASCYAIWIAANEDEDPRAIALKNDIMGLTLYMMKECDTIH